MLPAASFAGMVAITSSESAWMTLTVRGTKHDFGIVQYRYLPRPGELTDDMIRRVFRGAGEKAAELVAPYLTGQAAPAESKR